MNDDTDWQSVAAALSTQLDAEREKVERLQESLALGHVTDSNWRGIYEKKCRELDAERELRKEAEARYSLMQTMEADALREKVKSLVEALEKLKTWAMPDEPRAIIDDALAKVREEPMQLPMINEDPVITLK
jgi:hypothetical protein